MILQTTDFSLSLAGYKFFVKNDTNKKNTAYKTKIAQEKDESFTEDETFVLLIFFMFI